MSWDDSVTICGNVTRDPDLKYTASGSPVVNFSIAKNTRVKNDDGTYEDGEPSFFDISAWGTLAENIAESIEKGHRIVVYGDLKQDRWETEDGDKRSKVKINANDVAVSLKFATATSHKPERSDAPQQRREKPAARRPVPEYEEEPF